jgi:L-amino acid N-acyltransferase
MPTIRRALPADAEAIAEIVNALIPTSTIEWRYELHSPASMVNWIAVHDCVLVADDEKGLLGMAAFGPFRDITKWPGYRFTVENTVHVREDHWGSGIGRSLMHALIEEARKMGKHTMIAAIDGTNESSIRLHERLGFLEVARMPEVGAKFGRWLDLVLLQLQLDDRSDPGER